MSFNFEIKLTAPQIAMLTYFVRKSRGLSAEPLPKGASAATARALVSDGFLQVKKGRKIGEPTQWRVTRKAILAIEMIQEEMRQMKLPRPDTSLLFWYDMPEGASRGVGLHGKTPQGEISNEAL